MYLCLGLSHPWWGSPSWVSKAPDAKASRIQKIRKYSLDKGYLPFLVPCFPGREKVSQPRDSWLMLADGHGTPFRSFLLKGTLALSSSMGMSVKGKPVV